MWLLGVVGAAPVLMAAWPDTYPSRKLGISALQYDLISPELAPDPDQLSLRYEEACKKGFTLACQWESWQGAAGGDYKKADAFFSKKCSGEPLACVVAGWVRSRVDEEVSSEARDPKGAARYFKKTCKTDLYAPACTALGELYLAGVGVSQSATTASDLFREGCEAEDWWGCYQLGALYDEGIGVERDPVQAALLYERSCSQGTVQGCAGLAVLVESV